MICHACSTEFPGVPNLNQFFCESCEETGGPIAIYEVENILPNGNQTEFLCPNCPESTLEVGTIHKAQVCFCNSCQGFVIDSESFGGLVHVLRAEYKGKDDKPKLMDQKQLERKRRCPACLDNMNTHPYYGPGNVVIDSCLHCKLTWLDQTELTRIQRAPGRRG